MQGVQELRVEGWHDGTNALGLLSGLTLLVADWVARAPGPVQTSTLAGPSGIITRFNVIANVLARYALASEADRVTLKKIARHEAALLTDFAGGVHNDGSALMNLAALHAHGLSFLIQDFDPPPPHRAFVFLFDDSVTVTDAQLHWIQRPWRHRDRNPSDTLTHAFEAAIDARRPDFGYQLFDWPPPRTST